MEIDSRIEVAPGVALGAGKLGWRFARSGGPGGQNVNKLETKVTLMIELADLAAAMGPGGAGAVARLEAMASSQQIVGRQLVVTSQEERSQSGNRRLCMEKLRALVVAAMVKPKRRRKTKPTRGSVERRIESKKVRGQIKENRRRMD